MSVEEEEEGGKRKGNAHMDAQCPEAKDVPNTDMTPKTPPGPNPPALGSAATPPHAAELRTSKKYVHESMVPTKEGVAVFAGASRSQRKDMMVDLVRAEAFLPAASTSSGHGEPFV